MAEGPDGLQVVRSSSEWVAYFERNAAEVRTIPWQSGAGVTEAELTAIAASLRGWQLGETSDGAHLFAAAHHYASTTGDPNFVDAVRLFIAEEQRHGNNLGRFLDLAGVERAGSDWGDTLFRAVRYAVPRMEVWATPVVMVETHAMVYYNAVRRATESPVLRAICEQILADEVAHIRFQCERLAILHRRRPRWLRRLTMGLHRLMFAGITVAVWVGHRRALRAGGYDFGRFWRAVWGKMRFAWRVMSPDGYRWAEQPRPNQASNVALEMSIPMTAVVVVAAVPTASLPSCSRMRGRAAAATPGVASEVEERRRAGRHLVHEVGASRAACG